MPILPLFALVGAAVPTCLADASPLAELRYLRIRDEQIRTEILRMTAELRELAVRYEVGYETEEIFEWVEDEISEIMIPRVLRGKADDIRHAVESSMVVPDNCFPEVDEHAWKPLQRLQAELRMLASVIQDLERCERAMMKERRVG